VTFTKGTFGISFVSSRAATSPFMTGIDEESYWYMLRKPPHLLNALQQRVMTHDRLMPLLPLLRREAGLR
jgi:hypothetical protein